MPMMTTDVPIDEVVATAYTVPTDRPEGDGTLTWDSTTWVVVRVGTHDGGGASGVGWTYAPAAVARIVQDLLAPEVVGRSVLDVPAAWAAMARAVRNAGRTGMVAMALSAVDTALWDLKARLLGLPLHHLFGAVHETLTVYGSGGFTTDCEAHLRSQLRGWVDAGLPRVKIKIGESSGRDTDRDLARTGLAREEIGADVELFVDANGGYDAKQAIRVARRLGDLGVVWFEEPVSSDDHAGLRRVRESVDVDVTAGEYGDGLAYFSRLLAAGAVDCAQIDVTRCGGYSEWQRIAALAAGYGTEVSAHCAPTLTAPVALATPGLRHLEWFEDHVRIESRFLDPFCAPVEGSIAPSEAPGNGVSVRDADLAPYRVA